MKIKSLYSDDLDLNSPLSGHPDPYWQRDNFLNLNGKWDFLIDQKPDLPKEYPEKIIVPFAVESALSGINKTVHASDFLHYRRIVDIPSDHIGGAAILRFMAVDQECQVYVNKKLVSRHEGGYWPFSVYLPNLESSIEIEVVVKDDTSSSIHARGKQTLKPNTIWYTPTSGIWQEVYLEFLPKEGYIKHCRFQGDLAGGKLIFKAEFEGRRLEAKASVYFQGTKVNEGLFDEKGYLTLSLASSFHPWSPENPNLYEIVLEYGQDLVRSSFALREVKSVSLNGKRYLTLNGKPLLLNGLLDQGYWPESGLTAPSIEALKYDISFAKECGYNCLRKHIKIESRRWYHLCDLLGMCVIQDMVSGGAKYSPFLIALAPLLPLKVNDLNGKRLGRNSLKTKERFKKEVEETVDTLYNVGSILAWTLFNEGWGQFEAVKNTDLLRSLDQTRLIDATSGWYDKGVGDFNSKHIYFRPLHLKNDGKRLLSLSEFGGYSYHLPHNSWSEKTFGYRIYKNKEKLMKGISRLYLKEVAKFVKKEALSVIIYTELSDVEQEVNGLLSYDRKVVKVDPQVLHKINISLNEAYLKSYEKDKDNVPKRPI